MLGLLALATAVMLCKVDHARYVLRTAPDIIAEFQPVQGGGEWPSHLAFRIHSNSTGRTYWFLPWNGGVDGLQHLASTTDINLVGWAPPSPDGGPRPLGDIDYIATDEAYGVLASVPRLGENAPAHILLPNLGETLWHQRGDARDGAPRQFFDLQGCRR